MKKAVCEIEGQKFSVGSLTIKQVESYIEPLDESLSAEEQNKEYTRRSRQMVCDALNNGRSSIDENGKLKPPATPMTIDDLIETLDLKTFGELRRAVLDLSELKRADDAGDDDEKIDSLPNAQAAPTIVST